MRNNCEKLKKNYTFVVSIFVTSIQLFFLTFLKENSGMLASEKSGRVM